VDHAATELAREESLVRIRDIVIDARHPASLARFWAEALDGYAVRAYDTAEIERLAELGLTPETDPTVAVDGPGPTIFVQQMSEPKRARNRVHLDLVGLENREIEVGRLCALGARVRDPLDARGPRHDHTVMLDPEGNEFCVRDPD
jgi:hypothetical protein